MIIADPKNWL